MGTQSVTYTVRIDNQLNNIFGVAMQNLHSGSRYQRCKILGKTNKERKKSKTILPSVLANFIST